MKSSDTKNNFRKIEEHYMRSELTQSIFAALKKSGKDIENLSPEDLKPIDEFHVRGKLATLELAEKIGLDDSMRVLDIGSGIGGPSRLLALKYGCKVTGIDLTEEFCRVAVTLADKLELNHLLDYHYGNALNLPFANDSFDVVWSQHAAMNIENKSQLYSEMSRVLKPGGKLAINDILEGSDSPVIFPVPWSKVEDLSFLSSEERMRSLLSESGFEIKNWLDTTQIGLDWWLENRAMPEETNSQPLGISLLLGSGAKKMMSNVAKNLKEKRIKIIEIVAALPRESTE